MQRRSPPDRCRTQGPALLLAVLAVAPGCAFGDLDPASGGGGHVGTLDARSVDELCPITGDPIDPTRDGVQHDEVFVGFCTGNCRARWAQRTPTERETFVRRQLAGR